MSRTVFRAMAGVFALVAATAAIPLGSPAAAVADSIVIGGQPAHVKDNPWVVALSSRGRFGETRAGQFCGGVVVAPKKVLTAAHCLSREALGVEVGEVRDLRVISGRDDLRGTGGQETPVQAAWSNPGFDPATNAGDLAVLTLADALPTKSVIPMAASGDAAYEPGTGAVVYGWGDTTGNSDYASSLRSAEVSVLPDSLSPAGLPRRQRRYVRRLSDALRGRTAGWARRMPGRQRRAAGGPWAAHRAGVLGERLRPGREPRRVHADLCCDRLDAGR